MEDWQTKAENALAIVRALSRGKREWTMSVPAREDYDPDIVITDALVEMTRKIRELEDAARKKERIRR